jgi:hypothetical protein
VTHTAFVRPKAPAEPFYEVKMQPRSGQELTFVTRDEQVYKEAASFEGTEHFVIATCHDGKRDSERVLVLDHLGIDEGEVGSDSGSDLFN